MYDKTRLFGCCRVHDRFGETSERTSRITEPRSNFLMLAKWKWIYFLSSPPRSVWLLTAVCVVHTNVFFFSRREIFEPCSNATSRDFVFSALHLVLISYSGVLGKPRDPRKVEPWTPRISPNHGLLEWIGGTHERGIFGFRVFSRSINFGGYTKNNGVRREDYLLRRRTQ